MIDLPTQILELHFKSLEGLYSALESARFELDLEAIESLSRSIAILTGISSVEPGIQESSENDLKNKLEGK